MTLRLRLMLQLAISLAAIALLSAAAIVGVRGLRQDFAVALAANQQLRDVYEVGVRIAVAQAAMQSDPPQLVRATQLLRVAGQLLDAIEPAPPRDLIDTRPQLDATRAAIRASIVLLSTPNATAAVLARPMSALADLSAATRRAIEHAQLAADQKHRRIEAIVASLAGLTMTIVIALGWRQYRSVMRPLARLQKAVQLLAAGQLDERVVVAGDREFASLATEFNRMAGELHNVQRDLERRVAEKSRALIQSDRLASVGYLAAGVAHEINNPLGIIAGYGERSLQRLSSSASQSSEAIGTLARSIQIMCEETFRCKQITDRLLQLARPGDGSRCVISLATAAHEAITPLRGLKRFAAHTIEVAAGDFADGELLVSVNEGELRQLLLNLLINALEACPSNGGIVRVVLERDGDVVEMSVTDNGRGMTSVTAARVFEPFFTDKLNPWEHDTPQVGTGLGLSIAHAIVADHAGRIEVRSNGLGRGSAFIVRLPAAAQEVAR